MDYTFFPHNSNAKRRISLTKFVIIEVIIMFAYFTTTYSLWNIFDMVQLSRQIVFLWFIFIAGMIMIVFGVIYSHSGSKESKD